MQSTSEDDRKIAGNRFALLLGLTGSDILAAGNLPAAAQEFASAAFRAFNLLAAQIWHLQGTGCSWQCLVNQRADRDSRIELGEPGRQLSAGLAASSVEHSFDLGDAAQLHFRLIKPAEAQWPDDETRLAEAMANLLATAAKSAIMRDRIDDLIAAKITAEQANRSKTEFIAHISHELRAPLNAIIGFSEILAKEQFGAHTIARYREYAHDILHSGQHLLSLINDMLDLSRIETGNHTLHEEDVPLDEIIRSSLRMVHERATQKQLAIAAPGETGMMLFAEGRAIKQILINLLVNSIKFTPAGGSIRIEVIPGATDLQITVSDTGVGISQQQLAKLFLPYSRGADSPDQPEQGMGLGLAISRKLARLHGGDLQLASNAGAGARAVLTLPNARLLGAPEGLEV